MALLAAVAADPPDAAVVDVRMPPTFTDEGLRAALTMRAAYPGIGVLVFSQWVETSYARQLLSENAGGVGYLLKDRIVSTDEFVGALRRVADGGTALDPEVVRQLLAAPAVDAGLARLTAREREILGLLAEGRSNVAIAERCTWPNAASRSTSPPSSPSWTCRRRAPTTAACWPCCDISGHERPCCTLPAVIRPVHTREHDVSNMSRRSALGLGRRRGRGVGVSSPAQAAAAGPATIKKVYAKQKAKAGGLGTPTSPRWTHRRVSRSSRTTPTTSRTATACRSSPWPPPSWTRSTGAS